MSHVFGHKSWVQKRSAVAGDFKRQRRLTSLKIVRDVYRDVIGIFCQCGFGLLDGWLVGWLAGCLAGWLAGSLVTWVAGWLVGWSAGQLVGWLAGQLVG